MSKGYIYPKKSPDGHFVFLEDGDEYKRIKENVGRDGNRWELDGETHSYPFYVIKRGYTDWEDPVCIENPKFPDDWKEVFIADGHVVIEQLHGCYSTKKIPPGCQLFEQIPHSEYVN